MLLQPLARLAVQLLRLLCPSGHSSHHLPVPSSPSSQYWGSGCGQTGSPSLQGPTQKPVLVSGTQDLVWCHHLRSSNRSQFGPGATPWGRAISLMLLSHHPIGGFNANGQPPGFLWMQSPFSASDLCDWQPSFQRGSSRRKANGR